MEYILTDDVNLHSHPTKNDSEEESDATSAADQDIGRVL
jgi:hypothetical protein